MFKNPRHSLECMLLCLCAAVSVAATPLSDSIDITDKVVFGLCKNRHSEGLDRMAFKVGPYSIVTVLERNCGPEGSSPCPERVYWVYDMAGKIVGPADLECFDPVYGIALYQCYALYAAPGPSVSCYRDESSSEPEGGTLTGKPSLLVDGTSICLSGIWIHTPTPDAPDEKNYRMIPATVVKNWLVGCGFKKNRRVAR